MSGDSERYDDQPEPKRVRHRNGGTYIVVGEALAQTTRGICDYDQLIVYRSEEDGQLWVRPVGEFNDGRFKPVGSEAPSPEAQDN